MTEEMLGKLMLAHARAEGKVQAFPPTIKQNPLNETDRRVLRALERGYSNSEIGRRLQLSLPRVNQCIHKIRAFRANQ